MSQLLTADGEVFRFRHALTREAVCCGTAAAVSRRSLAGAALAAVEAAHPGLDGPWRDIAADLAAQSGDTGLGPGSSSPDRARRRWTVALSRLPPGRSGVPSP